MGPLIARNFLSADALEETNRILSDFTNETKILQNLNVTFSVTTVQVAEVTHTSDQANGKYTGKIFYAYLIVGLVMLISVVCLSFGFIMDNRSLKNKKPKNKKVQMNKTRIKQDNIFFKITILSLMSVFYASYLVVEMNYSSFLPTYVVKKLDWTKSAGKPVWPDFGIVTSLFKLYKGIHT